MNQLINMLGINNCTFPELLRTIFLSDTHYFVMWYSNLRARSLCVALLVKESHFSIHIPIHILAVIYRLFKGCNLYAQKLWFYKNFCTHTNHGLLVVFDSNNC